MQTLVDGQAMKGHISKGHADGQHACRNGNQRRVERAIPVRDLQELRNALSEKKDQGGVDKGDWGSAAGVAEGSVLILSGNLDKLVGFGDVRNYVGQDGCTIRRNNSEFSLQFPTPEAAQRCLAKVAAGVPTVSGSPTAGRPFVKDGKQRQVFLRFQTAGNPPVLPTPPPTQSPLPATEPSKASVSAHTNLTNLDRAKANSRPEKKKAPLERWGALPLETQQCEQRSEAGFVGPPPDPPRTSRELSSSKSMGYEHALSLDSGKPSPGESIGYEHGLGEGIGYEDELGGAKKNWGDELMVQEMLALVTKTAQWRREAQEKSRMVEHLTQREEMLRKALEDAHSRLMLYEAAIQDLTDCSAPATAKQSHLPDETSKKRKKSVTPPTQKTADASCHPDSSNEPEPTGWNENQSRTAEAEAFEQDATGWGGDILSPATPLDWNEPPAHHRGSFNTTGSGKSSPSGRSSRNRHRKGRQQLAGGTKGTGLGSKRVEATPRNGAWDEAVSGSSEAAELRMSGNSSAGGFWDEGIAGPSKRTHGVPPYRGIAQQTPQWDGRSSASSVGDGGMTTPPLQDGEWEWPVTPGKKALPSPKTRATSLVGSSARLNMTGTSGGSVKAGEGLLPVPTGWEEPDDGFSEGVRRVEPGEKAPVGFKSPGGGGRSSRGSDGRGRRKSGTDNRGDYAGAPREREVPEGRWPRGMVT